MADSPTEKPKLALIDYCMEEHASFPDELRARGLEVAAAPGLEEFLGKHDLEQFPVLIYNLGVGGICIDDVTNTNPNISLALLGPESSREGYQSSLDYFCMDAHIFTYDALDAIESVVRENQGMTLKTKEEALAKLDDVKGSLISRLPEELSDQEHGGFSSAINKLVGYAAVYIAVLYSKGFVMGKNLFPVEVLRRPESYRMNAFGVSRHIGAGKRLVKLSRELIEFPSPARQKVYRNLMAVIPRSSYLPEHLPDPRSKSF